MPSVHVLSHTATFWNIIIQETSHDDLTEKKSKSFFVHQFESYPAVTYAASKHQGRLFWIVCKRPAFLSYFSRFQLIQNLAPSVAGMRQCDIRITKLFCQY